MGNANSKDPNKQRVSLGLSEYSLASLPEKPSKFDNRLDYQVWSEFKSACRQSTQLDDIEERRQREKRATCCQWSGFVAIILGIIIGGAMGGGGGGTGNTGLMIAGIVLGALAFIGGFIVAQGNVIYIKGLKDNYVRDVRIKLDGLLMQINDKYRGQLEFTTRVGNGLNAGQMEYVHIDIVIHSEFVKYLNAKPIQQQGMCVFMLNHYRIVTNNGYVYIQL